jgi:hypothetical protein
VTVTAVLEVSRDRILAFRRGVQGLDERAPWSAEQVRRAAWAGLQDSMPRAAVLSLHARLDGVRADAWRDPLLVQLWGPRSNVYAVAAEDRGVFTRGRLAPSGPKRRRAEDLADQLRRAVGETPTSHREAGRYLDVHPNALRYAAPTGTVLVRWDGARRPDVWTVPPPEGDDRAFGLELARRYLHVAGPTTAEAFAGWAGLPVSRGRAIVDELRDELLPVRTPLGDAWGLTSDEVLLREAPEPTSAVRLLPSGDVLTLAWGAERELLVPDPAARASLWTSRVWPGGVLVHGELVGVWRRAGHVVTIEPWGRLGAAARAEVEAEAATLPLPALERDVAVTWV